MNKEELILAHQQAALMGLAQAQHSLDAALDAGCKSPRLAGVSDQVTSAIADMRAELALVGRR